MLILRQHNYTFADKRAIEQFMKLTSYGSHIPKGYKKLTAKDIVKLRDVAKVIDEKGIEAANPEEVKYYLNKLGFTKATENYQHLYDKYLHPDENPKLIKRFRRMKGLDYEGTKEYKEIQKLKRNPEEQVSGFFDKLKRIHQDIIRKGKINDYNFKAGVHNNATKKDYNKKGMYWWNRFKQFNAYDPKTAEIIKRRAKQKGITITTPPQDTKIISKWNAAYLPKKKTIYIKEESPLNNNPFIIGHEKGHSSNFHNSRAGLSYLVDELGASAHSMAENRRLMRKTNLEVGRKQLEAAGNTYFNDTYNKIIDRFNSNYKRKSLIPKE